MRRIFLGMAISVYSSQGFKANADSRQGFSRGPNEPERVVELIGVDHVAIDSRVRRAAAIARDVDIYAGLIGVIHPNVRHG
jgi:hypothetical protein